MATALLVLGYAPVGDAEISPEVAVSPVGQTVLRSGIQPAVATDGHDYLVAWSQPYGTAEVEPPVDLLARRFASDGTAIDEAPTTIFTNLPSAPQPQIACLAGRYLIAAASGYGKPTLQLAILESTRLVRAWAINSDQDPDDPFVSSNGDSFLLTYSDPVSQGTTALLLDSDGRTQSSTTFSGSVVALASDGEDFLAITEETASAPGCIGACTESFAAQRVSATGNASSHVPLFSVNAGSSDFVDAVTLAWDGSHYAIMWFTATAGISAQSELHAMAVGSNGVVVEPARLVVTITPPASDSAQLVWTGSSFAALGFDGLSSVLYRIPQSLDSATRIDSPGGELAIGSNGVSSLLVWSEGRFNTPTPRVFARLLSTDLSVGDDSRTMMPVSTPRPLHQQNPKIAGDAAQRLVVWRESESDYGTSTIRAARIDENGHPLDSIEIATAGGFADLSVASSGAGYLIVWEAGGSIRCRAVDRDGNLGTVTDLPGAPLVLAPDAVWTGENYFVVWTAYETRDGDPPSNAHVVGMQVAADGTPIDAAPSSISTDPGQQRTPAVAWNGRSLLVAWEQNAFGTCRKGVCDDERSIVTTVASPAGVPTLPVTITAATPESISGLGERPRVAAGNDQFVVTWAEGLSVRAVRLDSSGNSLDTPPAVIATATGRPAHPAAVWDGKAFEIVFDRTEETHSRDEKFEIAAAVCDHDENVGTASVLAASSDLETAPAAIAPGLQLDLVYVRFAREPEYGGAARVFYRQSESTTRVRAVRR